MFLAFYITPVTLFFLSDHTSCLLSLFQSCLEFTNKSFYHIYGSCPVDLQSTALSQSQLFLYYISNCYTCWYLMQHICLESLTTYVSGSDLTTDLVTAHLLSLIFKLSFESTNFKLIFINHHHFVMFSFLNLLFFFGHFACFFAPIQPMGVSLNWTVQSSKQLYWNPNQEVVLVHSSHDDHNLVIAQHYYFILFINIICQCK